MKLALHLLFLLFTKILFCQDIKCTQERKLEFNDLKSTSFQDDNFSAAGSSVTISFRIVSTSIWTGKTKIKIYAVFNSQKSWFRKKEQFSDRYVLNHEQKHFDIAHAFV